MKVCECQIIPIFGNAFPRWCFSSGVPQTYMHLWYKAREWKIIIIVVFPNRLSINGLWRGGWPTVGRGTRNQMKGNLFRTMIRTMRKVMGRIINVGMMRSDLLSSAIQTSSKSSSLLSSSGGIQTRDGSWLCQERGGCQVIILIIHLKTTKRDIRLQYYVKLPKIGNFH